MEEESNIILELRRQLREAERREKEEREAREKEREAAEEVVQQLQLNTLFRLLDRCHHSLSQAIKIETDETLTTKGDATNPVNRLYPKRILPWLDFPRSQERVWRKIERSAAFTSRQIFPNNNQIDLVVRNVRNKSIYSEASLRNFEQETVDNFVELIIEALQEDATLRHEFGIQGRVAFYDRADNEEVPPENSSGQVHLQNSGRGRNRDMGRMRGAAAQRQQKAGNARRRNRRADQFCVHVIADERRQPVYAVEFKAPHKITIPELVAGLHATDLARDVINQEGDTFEFYATRLVAAVITQIFSYMIDSGVRYGYICTGEAFVFLCVPNDDPTLVQYSLCVPNQDVQADGELCLQRTAIGQVLAFTLHALAAEAPPQEWHTAALDQLSTWTVEYMDVLRDIPETIRKDPPTSSYRPSHWKATPKIHYTRSYSRCRPGISTPTHSSTEGSDGDDELRSPSTAAAARGQSNRNRRINSGQKTKGSESSRTGRDREMRQSEGHSSRPYCSIACIRGIVKQDLLDKGCPNWGDHGGPRHSMGPQEFTRQLHLQLCRDPNYGFEQLHIRGRTGYLVKATLLSHGYTVIIKATTPEKQHRLQAEASNYRKLRILQGQQIPVCLGVFTPRVAYWYHGELMGLMMILSWSGKRLQFAINNENASFFHQERDKVLGVLQSHGVVHGDREWRNMLWDELSNSLIVIDLEDVEWLKSSRALVPTSGNSRRGHSIRAGKQPRSGAQPNGTLELDMLNSRKRDRPS